MVRHVEGVRHHLRARQAVVARLYIYAFGKLSGALPPQIRRRAVQIIRPSRQVERRPQLVGVHRHHTVHIIHRIIASATLRPARVFQLEVGRPTTLEICISRVIYPVNGRTGRHERALIF